jgi:hypothetical protein
MPTLILFSSPLALDDLLAQPVKASAKMKIYE